MTDDSRVRGEFLDGELFSLVDEMKYVVERWWMDYNHYEALSSPIYMIGRLCRTLS